MNGRRAHKVIISGGGTGGHIFPALSIAQALRKIEPDIDILFVGAEGKMEMEKVPAAGFPIIGLPVAGLQRSLSSSNFSLPFKVFKSIRKASKIIHDFRPDVVVGVGGYASAPMLWTASRKGIPTLIQEQNSYAGLTNKIVSKNARKICVAYEGMEKFFPADRILFTGNPIREDIRPATEELRAEAMKFFRLDPSIPTALIIGGSLGCGTLNSVLRDICAFTHCNTPYQIIWQNGKSYSDSTYAFLKDMDEFREEGDLRICGQVRNCDFISRMDLAFAAADIVVTRAGAGTISELCSIGKAAIFVPSPNVAEDHQTHNAMAIVNKDAAMMVRDADARMELPNAMHQLILDKGRIRRFEENILKLAKPEASKVIAEEVLKLIK